MKSHSVRLTLFSLLGLSTAQTSSSSIPIVATSSASASSSRESLLSPSSATPTIRGPPPIQTGVSRNSTFVVTESAASGSTSSTATGAGATRSTAAAAAGGMEKMGFVGVLAGAAGVVFV
ncbi:hypothetical protein HBI24_215150 [Parastagonospora nodorum]|nr:hypothetical protein HBH52_195490 [Parastagonospora nodorum]KAH4115191.1 hypothetical protein HBH47_184330 [Parastagonospora nodorum]KAH4956793.1 hypothetical protein HBI78_196770 [Parastagonospora nodorum]KAH5176822.1 hypothetical protein HBH76_209740 [Parastagonospora nodorum]KAH5206839.1 hypothetical protein HBH77_094690 [Parastagonospora nodorum]